jgi:hypothetical protein
MVQADRTIGIDQHQRARLIEMRGGEADPNFTGVMAMPFFSTVLCALNAATAATRA